MTRPAPSEAEAETLPGPAVETDARAVAEPGRAIAVLATIMGFLWIAAAVLGSLVLFGADRLQSASPVELAALVAGILMPACMAWFSGAAASEAARSRSEARRLAEAADRLMNPAQTAELGAKRLANTVRSEISALEKAIENTISRLKDVETMVGKQTELVESMSQRAKTGAAQMILGMDRERAELIKISTDLNSQATNIGDSISRHTKVIAEAARLAEAEVRAADKALEVRISSFGAAASLITDRTQALDHAAKGSADSALRLEHALSGALDILGRATELTDAARQSADAAAYAASETSGAVRETTVRAIEDAKRAADLIRGEAGQVERDAHVALEKLRGAAEAARFSAQEARVAAEAQIHAQARASAPPHPAQQVRHPYSTPQQHAVQQHAPPQDWRRDPGPDWREDTQSSPQRAPQNPPQRPPQGENLFGDPPPRAPERRPASDPRHEPSRAPAPAAGGNWTWRDLMSNVDDTSAPATPRRRVRSDDDAVKRIAQSISEPRPAPAAPAAAGANAGALPAAAMIEHAGIRLSEVFSASAMDRIAQRARSGTNQRRRAVTDAAPEAVLHLTQFLHADSRAMNEAMAFLKSDGARIAELLGRGRAAMGADATRAFLLLDAAAG